MSNFFGCLKYAGFGIVLLGGIVVATGNWLTSNEDKVAEALVEASGVKEAVANERRAKCERAKRRAQAAWDKSVESGQIANRSDEIDAMDAEVRELCKS
jgi:hypothetical protein